MGEAIIDRLARPNPLSVEEKRVADWVTTRPEDVRVIFSTIFDTETDQAWDTITLAVEEALPDGRIAAQFIELLEHGSPDLWERMEDLARAGLERVKQEALA